jgi:UDP-N-acetylmuramoyl-tripeptide--D-alanyl-D-alanine ligase
MKSGVRERSRRLWRRLPGLLLTSPGRCLVRQTVLEPMEPLLMRLAGTRRRFAGTSHRLIGVTGSFGKTTTSRAIRCALGETVGTSAGPNSGAALSRALLGQSFRRPYSVFELGIGRLGQMAPTARAFRPDVVVVTSIGGEHAVSLGTRERTRDEKFELIRGMAPGGIAVMNGDDPHVRWMIERVPGRVITFGTGEDNDVRAGSMVLEWPHGTRMDIRIGSWQATVRVRLVGDHVAYAILAAVAVAHAVGVAPDVALERLTRLDPTPGRMQVVPLAGGAFLLRDEYKSGLETIDRALELLAQIPAPRRIIVLGEITEPPSPQHQQYVLLGQRVAPLVDRAVVLGKKTAGYRTGLKRGGLAADRIVDAGRSWRRAFEALDGTLGPGDVVLLKGRHDERLERVALALAGYNVGCELVVCNTPLGRCDTCAMRERGWGRIEPVF